LREGDSAREADHRERDAGGRADACVAPVKPVRGGGDTHDRRGGGRRVLLVGVGAHDPVRRGRSRCRRGPRELSGLLVGVGPHDPTGLPGIGGRCRRGDRGERECDRPGRPDVLMVKHVAVLPGVADHLCDRVCENRAVGRCRSGWKRLEAG
jgi:hypothetical protein